MTCALRAPRRSSVQLSSCVLPVRALANTCFLRRGTTLSSPLPKVNAAGTPRPRVSPLSIRLRGGISSCKRDVCTSTRACPAESAEPRFERACRLSRQPSLRTVRCRSVGLRGRRRRKPLRVRYHPKLPCYQQDTTGAPDDHHSERVALRPRWLRGRAPCERPAREHRHAPPRLAGRRRCPEGHWPGRRTC